jgi:hypothetical protein
MKAYVIRSDMDVFNGTGRLTADAARALRGIADIVADSLQEGGDKCHQASVWEGQREAGTPPTLITLSDRQSLVALTLRLLDPNDLLGGDIRSAVNCRTATFGQDGQAMLCLRHEDALPTAAEGSMFSVTDCSERLTATDLFDGGWPSA